MNVSNIEERNVRGSVVSSAANTRLSGSWLIIARVAWLVLAIPCVGFFVVSLPAYYQQLKRGCADPLTCSLAGALSSQAFSSMHISASWYAALLTIFFVIIETIWYGVGFLLFWRKSADWFALLAAFFLVVFNGALALPSPALDLPLSFVSFLSQASLGIFLLLFPNGRLVPRWMGLSLLLVIVYAFVNNLPSKNAPFDGNWPEWLYLVAALVVYGPIVFSQIYRYRRVSTPVQRQQTKWVISGVTVVAVAYIGLLFVGTLNPSLNSSLLFNEVWSLIFPVILLLIPLSIGFSILRYRLYDIDVLINRSLVYGTLTLLLALVYIGLVVGLQALMHVFPGQETQSPVVIVVSTLVIATLFQPLRHRLQAMIDRRFYRRKYDAARTLEAFSASLRNEVDLAQLSEQLIAVVQETMQPAHVSLWLRPPGRREPRLLQTEKP